MLFPNGVRQVRTPFQESKVRAEALSIVCFVQIAIGSGAQDPSLPQVEMVDAQGCNDKSLQETK